MRVLSLNEQSNPKDFFQSLSECEEAYTADLNTVHSIGLPKFNQMKWASREVRANTNCMSYAFDLLDKGGASPGYLRMPDVRDAARLRGSFIECNKISLEFCKVGLEHDGCTEISENDYDPEHPVVALFFREDTDSKEEDFHFLRLDSDGYWSDASIVNGHDEQKDIRIQKYKHGGIKGGIDKAFNVVTSKDNPLKQCPKGFVRYTKGYEQFGGFYKLPKELNYFPDSRLISANV